MPGSPRGGKIRTFLSFSILAQVRFYTKRTPETGYRFLGLCSPKDALTSLSKEARHGKLRRNPVAVAREWQSLLDSGRVTSRAALARELGVSRAHVTQVLRILQLGPPVIARVLALGDPMEGRMFGAHILRSIVRLPAEVQERRVWEMIKRPSRQSLSSIPESREGLH